MAKSQAKGIHLNETKHINKSLSALGNVISALSEKRNHIPYRDSKLTYLLQDSFGKNHFYTKLTVLSAGGSKCALFVQISPSAAHAHETSCTLQFASRARSVQLGLARKNIVKGFYNEEDLGKLHKLKEQVKVILNITD